MRLLYPCNPFEKKRPDDFYQDEFDAAVAAGIPCSLFSSEDLGSGQFKPFPAIQAEEKILYRGWMLALDAYAVLCDAIQSKGALPVTSLQQYRLCHHLPNWYEACREFTPETVFLSKGDDFCRSLVGLKWPAYFVKDYVKSLTTSRGSVARSCEEVAEIVSLIESYRGSIEGGVCVRRFEQLVPDSEERYFVLNGKAFGHNESIPYLVLEIAGRISSPFFSVDVVSSADGNLRLIELGDGQVSDRKLWPVARFIEMLSTSG
jgi:hypothetical protein